SKMNLSKNSNEASGTGIAPICPDSHGRDSRATALPGSAAERETESRGLRRVAGRVPLCRLAVGDTVAWQAALRVFGYGTVLIAMLVLAGCKGMTQPGER